MADTKCGAGNQQSQRCATAGQFSTRISIGSCTRTFSAVGGWADLIDPSRGLRYIVFGTIGALSVVCLPTANVVVVDSLLVHIILVAHLEDRSTVDGLALGKSLERSVGRDALVAKSLMFGSIVEAGPGLHTLQWFPTGQHTQLEPDRPLFSEATRHFTGAAG